MVLEFLDANTQLHGTRTCRSPRFHFTLSLVLFLFSLSASFIKFRVSCKRNNEVIVGHLSTECQQLTSICVLERLELVVVPWRSIIFPVWVRIWAGVEQNFTRTVVLGGTGIVHDVVIVNSRRWMGVRIATRRRRMMVHLIVGLLLELFVSWLLLETSPLVVFPSIANIADSRGDQIAVGGIHIKIGAQRQSWSGERWRWILRRLKRWNIGTVNWESRSYQTHIHIAPILLIPIVSTIVWSGNGRVIALVLERSHWCNAACSRRNAAAWRLF